MENLNEDFEFECNIDESYIENTCVDEWGAAFVWLGDNGCEYNFCIDAESNSSAIYKTNASGKYLDTDYSTFTHYEVDFANKNWKNELKDAMIQAYKVFFWDTKLNKWKDICFNAENVASEVLDVGKAAEELTKDEMQEILDWTGDSEYVFVNDNKEIVSFSQAENK